MYQPKVFREEERARLHDVIEHHSFGMLLVTRAPGELEIAHLPFLLDRAEGEHGHLRLHVAKANPIWKAALAAGRVTAVFSGPHAFVSASWYEQPSMQVPTWNYVVVHAHGQPEIMEPDALVALLDDLSRVHEPAVEGWPMSGLDATLRAQLVAQIVGIRIPIASLDGKFKLSQNRSAVDHARVVAAFRQRATPDDLALAELMTPRPA